MHPGLHDLLEYTSTGEEFRQIYCPPFRSHETHSLGIAPEMAECHKQPEIVEVKAGQCSFDPANAKLSPKCSRIPCVNRFSGSVFGSVQRQEKILEPRTELSVQVRGFTEPEPELCVRFSPVQVRTEIPSRTLPTLELGISRLKLRRTGMSRTFCYTRCPGLF
jgi:hypothetical protein